VCAEGFEKTLRDKQDNMELKKGNISILVNEDRTTIEVMDSISSITFVKVTLTPEQLSSALSRFCLTPCEKVEVFGLERVGKKREVKFFEFEHQFDISNRDIERMNEEGKRFIDLVKEETLNRLGEEWHPSLYFGSKNSFYTKDGKKFARTHASRWVNQEENLPNESAS
jgi:hypothetical protein